MSDIDQEAAFQARLARHLEGRSFPVGTYIDEEILREVFNLSSHLPGGFDEMIRYLRDVQSQAVYAIAESFANELFLEHADALVKAAPRSLFHTTDVAIPESLCARLARRYAKHPELRGPAAQLAERIGVDEVALPKNAGERWDHTGWRKGISSGEIFRHARGIRRQTEVGVPPLERIEDIRELLDIQSESQLGFLLLASDESDLKPYHTFTIPKKSGGERVIAAPNPQLRAVQQKILSKILAPIPTHDAAHGFVPGRSTLSNATPHVGKDLLIKFDLHDFFGTIGYWRVVGLFASFGYEVGGMNFSKTDDDVEVAPTLARLCCYASRATQTRHAATPQGAPTSPAISNLICRTLDKRLTNLAESIGGAYTRYADDLTFSFDETPNKGIGRFRWWVNQICQQEGFLVREDKFRVIRSSQQQRVTGIVVNDQLGIPRRERRKFRAIVHNCEQHGVASQARGRDRFEDYLMGYAAYMNMVHPDEGGEMLQRVKALLAAGGSDE